MGGRSRELQNIIKRAVIFTENRIIMEEDIVFPQIKKHKEPVHKYHLPMEKIINTLVKHQGNKTKAAKELGISRRHIYRLLNFRE